MLAGALALAGAVSAILVGPRLMRAAREGRAALAEGRQAIESQDVATARASFARAKALFVAAESRLSSPLSWPLRMIPVASTHVGVGESLASIGSFAAAAGRAATEALAQLPGAELRLDHGRINVEAVARASAAMRQGLPAAQGIADELSRMPGGWVMPILGNARSEARDILPGGVDALNKVQMTLDTLPSILGQGTTKHYLVAFSNLSELRGSGGLFGFVTELQAKKGTLSLEAFQGRPTEVLPPPGEVAQAFPSWFPPDFKTQAGIFQNINLTTDFPTVGRIALDTAKAKIKPVQSMIAVDPIAISALLRVTGPIDIDQWPQRITAGNVADIAMHDVYLRIKQEGVRQKFFSSLVRETFGKLTTTSVKITPQLVSSLDGAVRAGHLRMFSTIARDQTVFDSLGVSGSTGRAAGASDVLSVVTENATGNKEDWYLRRDIHYVVQLDPKGDRAVTSLDVRFRNNAPSGGLPDYIIGGKVSGLPRGTNRQIVMLLRAPGDKEQKIAIAGRAVRPLETVEGSLRAYRASTDIPPMGSTALHATSVVNNAFVGAGETRHYRLQVLAQAVAHPDFLEVEIGVPSGWKAVGKTRFVDDLTGDFTMDVLVRREPTGRLIDTVIAPFRWVKKFVGRYV